MDFKLRKLASHTHSLYSNYKEYSVGRYKPLFMYVQPSMAPCVFVTWRLKSYISGMVLPTVLYAINMVGRLTPHIRTYVTQGTRSTMRCH